MLYPCVGGCGRKVHGLRCRECNAKFERVQAAVEMAEEDTQLLRDHEVLGMSKADMARSRQVTRPAIGQRIAKARERQRLLQEFQEIAS